MVEDDRGLAGQPAYEAPVRHPASDGIATSPLQDRILAIARKFLERHYVIDTNAIRQECNWTIKDVPVAEIHEALDDLFDRMVLVDGKAVTRQNVLENPTRRKILDIILHDPGIHFSRLVKTSGEIPRTVQWHMQMLVRYNIIRAAQFGNHVAYFDHQLGKQHDRVYHVMHKDGVVAIAKVILLAPGISNVTLFSQVELPRKTLARKLTLLVSEKIVTVSVNDDLSSSLCIRPDLGPIVQQCIDSTE